MLFNLKTKQQRDVLLPQVVSFIQEVRWLPSGKQLLVLFSSGYSGVRDLGSQLGMLSVGSGYFRRVTNDWIDHEGISLSGDGKTIATLFKQRRAEVRFYDASGTTLTSTAPVPQRADTIAWLNEDQLVMAPYPEVLNRGSGEFNEFSLNLPPGPGSRTYWNSDVANTTPAVCEDGRLIFDLAVNNEFWLLLTDSHGQYLRTLIKVQAGGMFCQQDKDRVYYSPANSAEASIWSVPLSGGEAKKLLPLPRPSPVVYSSDGRFAAYLVESAGRSTAGVVDLNERKVEREFTLGNHAQGTLPHFTPDGHALAFVEEEKGGFSLVIQPLDGSKPHSVTGRFKDPILDCGWSPSGKLLAIYLDESTSDDNVG